MLQSLRLSPGAEHPVFLPTYTQPQVQRSCLVLMVKMDLLCKTNREISDICQCILFLRRNAVVCRSRRIRQGSVLRILKFESVDLTQSTCYRMWSAALKALCVSGIPCPKGRVFRKAWKKSQWRRQESGQKPPLSRHSQTRPRILWSRTVRIKANSLFAFERFLYEPDGIGDVFNLL